jgi:hypothetical protein
LVHLLTLGSGFLLRGQALRVALLRRLPELCPPLLCLARLLLCGRVFSISLCLDFGVLLFDLPLAFRKLGSDLPWLVWIAATEGVELGRGWGGGVLSRLPFGKLGYTLGPLFEHGF